MLPKLLALVDDDETFAEFLSRYLESRGVAVARFSSSNDLLAHERAYEFDFYVLDLMLPGIDGLDLIKVLRLRTSAGLLVVSGRMSPDVFKEVVEAGADMYLAKPVLFEQVAVAVQAVQRRAAAVTAPMLDWKLDRRARQIVAPDGVRVDLSEIDLSIFECLLAAQGQAVTRDELRDRLGEAGKQDDSDTLTATIYRLRRRIERATPMTVPLHSKAKVGYIFKAPLSEI